MARAYKVKFGHGAERTPPSTPVLTATAVSETTIQVSWTPATDNVLMVGYRLHISTGQVIIVPHFTTLPRFLHDDCYDFSMEILPRARFRVHRDPACGQGSQ